MVSTAVTQAITTLNEAESRFRLVRTGVQISLMSGTPNFRRYRMLSNLS